MASIEAAHLSPTADELTAAQAAVGEYDFIRFTTADMNGVPRGILVPADAAVKVLESGIGHCATLQACSPTVKVVPKEVRDRHFANAYAIPDLSTLRPVPWVKNYRVGQFMAETYWNATSPQEACTRNIARRMLSKLDNMGLKLYSAVEREFILINNKTQLPLFPGDQYMLMPIQAEYEPWLYDVASNMKKAGVDIATMHLEGFVAGFEFTMQPKFGIEAADCALILKQGIKEMAIQRGWQANFMMVPFHGEPSSTCHFNFSVWNKVSGVNAFCGESTENDISAFGKHWIAGMIFHAKALTALSRITTNCYRAPHTPLDPHKANWGVEDRVAMLRVKNHGPGGTYIENRIGLGPTNPYLLMAATIAAGLDGVVHKLPCPDPHDVSEAAVELPHSLKEALVCLQEDTVMVEELGATFVEWFVQTKTEADLKIIEGVTDDEQLIDFERKHYGYCM